MRVDPYQEEDLARPEGLAEHGAHDEHLPRRLRSAGGSKISWRGLRLRKCIFTNTPWKTLDEIYQIYMLLHLFNRTNSATLLLLQRISTN